MSGLLILADDLSGALDTGIQFSLAHFSVEVFPFYDRIKAPDVTAGEAAVRVINTASRHIGAGEARDRVLSLGDLIRASSWVYKKTDSTLRGRVGAELEAFMEARGVSLLPFVPAYPELGRAVSGGRVFLNGTPLDLSSMARDPLNPVRYSEIDKIIGEESSVPVSLVAEGGKIDRKKEKGIIVFDSSSVEAIDRIGDYLESEGLLEAAAGSAGFARILAEKLPPDFARGQTETTVNKKLPLLIISGSLNPVSAEQISFAVSSGIPHIELSSSVLAGCSAGTGDLSDEKEKVLAFLTIEKIAVISLNGDLPESLLPKAPEQTPASGLAKFAAGIMRSLGPVNIAVSGGDTLLALITELGSALIRPAGEIEPGVVLSEVEAMPGRLVSKSGAFGTRQTLVKIAALMRDARSFLP